MIDDDDDDVSSHLSLGLRPQALRLAAGSILVGVVVLALKTGGKP
jgi:hypothetical protein